jgi:hypothetical protein
MHIFDWIMLVLSVFFAVTSLACFLIFIGMDIPVFIDRARVLRRFLFMSLLLWFNIRVWGNVIYTIIHWHS